MEHVSVLSQEVIEYLAMTPHGVYVDGTLGAAGHSRLIAEKLSDKGTLIAFDLDPASLAHARHIVEDFPAPKIHLVERNFKDMHAVLDELGIGQVDGILLDLGWNSDQFADQTRGFSFQHDGPLDMTFSQTMGSEEQTSAWDIVNLWQESSLVDILYGYADEPYAKRIARAILLARNEGEINSTQQLVAIIQSAVPKAYLHKKIHPATRTFQALRIAVNDEIQSLRSALPDMVTRLAPGGRLLIITFHSIEDRIVKHFFRNLELEKKILRIEKRGITASEQELRSNPRSRSARLRIAEKI